MSGYVDLKYEYFRLQPTQMGEITIFGTWYFDMVEGSIPEPCLVLIPRGQETNPHTDPAILALSFAFIFSTDPEVADPRAAARWCFRALTKLRLDTGNPRLLVRLGVCIQDHLEDLLKIPPFAEKRQRGNAIGEIAVTNNATGVVHRDILTDG